MNKVFGLKNDFAHVREEGSRIVICYGHEKKDRKHYECNEVYLYKKKMPGSLSLQMVKDAILGDIDESTRHRILTGFEWNGVKVWLSQEKQVDFSEAQRMAAADSSILPMTFKIGEDADGHPVYHTFETPEELTDFWGQAFAFIIQCLADGCQQKDSIDWTPYEELFPQQENATL